MSLGRRRLIVVCIDGGLPSIIRQHDFFNLTRRLPALRGTAVAELPTIYPSSTAPAHASLLTGTHPNRHGIVGNRFWERQSSAEIRRRADDPLSAFHPYESTSLTAPSVLDRLTREGATAVAVHFPHTFSRAAHRAIASCYCLYSPARDIVVELAPAGPMAAEGHVTLSYPGHELYLNARLDQHQGTIAISTGQENPTVLGNDRPTRLEIPVASGGISVAASFQRRDRDRIHLRLGTAVITMGFGGFSPVKAKGREGPASLDVEYTANPHHNFHESPRAEWVEQATLDMLTEHDPDLLFVRFNQTDHAQEFLYWYAVRGSSAERANASQQILDVYARIDACVNRLAEAVGDQAEFLLVSDHGIDYVETHLHPNRVLADLGFADRMVFQGDSNCAYLYADSSLSAHEERQLCTVLRALDPSVVVLAPSDLASLKLPFESPRVGRMAVTCGQHMEFQYGDAALRETVASASHGYFPSDSAMSGFYRFFGSVSSRLALPRDITGVASAVHTIYDHLSQRNEHTRQR